MQLDAPVRIATEYQIQDFDVFSIGLETHYKCNRNRKIGTGQNDAKIRIFWDRESAEGAKNRAWADRQPISPGYNPFAPLALRKTSVRAMKAGAIEFLTKPFRDEELLNAINQAIERDEIERLKNEAARALVLQ